MEPKDEGHSRRKVNKVDVIKRLIFLVFIVIPIPLFYGVYLTSYLQATVPDTAWVSWYDSPNDTVYIGWETVENESGTIFYGVDSSNLNLSKVESTAVKFHNVNISGLLPDTKYYYRIVMSGSDYTRGEFRTAPNAIQQFTFGLISDTQQKLGPGWHHHTGRILNGKDYSFVALVGDFVEDGKKAEWNDFFTQASQYLDTIPFIPVRGNHDKPRDLDGDGSDESYYFEKYFPQTADVVTGLNPYDVRKQFYFSFNWSNVHFQILHFPEVDIDDFDEPGGLNPRDYNQSFTPDQLAWISDDLEDAQSMTFRVTLFHCPITSSGFYGPNWVMKRDLLPLLHQYNVTATVSGHAHHYERGTLLNETSYPNNPLTYFVVGCGGGLTDVGLRPVPETDVTLASPCYTEVTATATSLTFNTYGLEGTLLDTFTILA
ncbi:MAG: metallophosphoesterase [Promethearchaeota archaeon]